MSANTPAARDILGLNSPEFIEIPDAYGTVRVDAIAFIGIQGDKLSIRLKGISAATDIFYPSAEKCRMAYEALSKLLTQ